jgi:hypothetical protein
MNPNTTTEYRDLPLADYRTGATSKESRHLGCVACGCSHFPSSGRYFSWWPVYGMNEVKTFVNTCRSTFLIHSQS